MAHKNLLHFFNERQLLKKNRPTIPSWLTKLVEVKLKNKQTVKQKYLVRTHLEMRVDREKVRKDLKVEAARGDQTVHRGASRGDEIYIYSLNYAYQKLNHIQTKTHRAAGLEFYETVAYHLPYGTVLNDFPLKRSDVRLIWATFMGASLLGKKKTRLKKMKDLVTDPYGLAIMHAKKYTMLGRRATNVKLLAHLVVLMR